MRSCGGGQVSSGRESPDADAIGLNPQLFGMGSHVADRSLCVSEFDRVMVLGSQPVLQHESRNAQRVEPACHVLALISDRQVRIAAARTDNHGGRNFRLTRGRKRLKQWY